MRINSLLLPLSAAIFTRIVLPPIYKKKLNENFKEEILNRKKSIRPLTCFLSKEDTKFRASSSLKNNTNATPLLSRVCLSFSTVTLGKKCCYKNMNKTMIKSFNTINSSWKTGFRLSFIMTLFWNTWRVLLQNRLKWKQNIYNLLHVLHKIAGKKCKQHRCLMPIFRTENKINIFPTLLSKAC